MSRILVLILSLMTTLTADDEVPPAPATPAALAWTDLTDWITGANKGISVVALTPSGDQLLIGMPDRGLLASSDERKTWTVLGKDQRN